MCRKIPPKTAQQHLRLYLLASHYPWAVLQWTLQGRSASTALPGVEWNCMLLHINTIPQGWHKLSGWLVHTRYGTTMDASVVVGTCRPAALEVVAAHYSAGTLLLSEAAGADGRATQLLLATRNYTLPLAASTTNASFGNQGLGGLRELITELDNFVPGTALHHLGCRWSALTIHPCIHPSMGQIRLAPAGLPTCMFVMIEKMSEKCTIFCHACRGDMCH